jgi:hypothetical protein
VIFWTAMTLFQESESDTSGEHMKAPA